MNGHQNHSFTSLKDIQRILEHRERENFSRKFGRSGYELAMFYSNCGVRIIGIRSKNSPESQVSKWV